MCQEQVFIRQLVEEMIESGRSAEDVCGDHPSLIDDVRQLWQRARVVEEQIDALFPSPDVADGAATIESHDAAQVKIPGYHIERILGCGGMGVVYKAQHIALNRSVAIKVPLAGAFSGAFERHRHMREAQAVAALCHPNIVTVHDVGECDGRPYFTMEFIDGRHLGAQLSNTPQPAREAATMLATLADAMYCAHQAGIVHRDLKPGNVLLTADGTPKITDFGLARHSGGDATLTVAGLQIGTPSYMSPEQASGRSAAQSLSVDIYALGAILYEMLTGRPPFRAETTMETLRQVLNEEPAQPSRLNRKVPRDLETICLTCLRKDPRRRYQDAHALADDLRRFLNGEPIRARPVSSVERLYRWTRRRPSQAAAWFGTAVAVGTILGVVLWTVSQRAAIERAVSDDLAEVVRLEESSDWRAARNMLERARVRLGAAAGRDRLQQRVFEIERELDLVEQLGALRFDRAASREVGDVAGWGGAKWWRVYHDLFCQAGLLHDGDSPEAFAARVAGSPARTALVGAMDDWAICATDTGELDWLLSATRLADPDPQWRDRARDAAIWKDHDALAALARDAQVDQQPVTLLLTVAGRLLEHGDAGAEALLRRIQAAHPSDFWANFAIGEVLEGQGDADSIGYFQAAIALRPEAAPAYVNLGNAFSKLGRNADSIEPMMRAVTLDPNSFTAQFNLAASLLEAHRYQEALEPARNAARISPDQQLGHRVLGRAFAMLGMYCEAADSFRRALEYPPDDDTLRAFLARAMSMCEADDHVP